VKLADGKARTIQHMMVTSFWHPDGTPMSAQQFLEMLFGKLPDFFKNEAELRTLWSAPDTRAKLLQGLAEKGFGSDQMAEMQRVINAEKSDLFDVLAHVAYALPPLTREERATNAKVVISTHFNTKQQVFLDFVLSQYVKVGVQELDQEKLSPLLKLKYNNAIADAVADLGRPEEIGRSSLASRSTSTSEWHDANPSRHVLTAAAIPFSGSLAPHASDTAHCRVNQSCHKLMIK